MVFVVVVCLFVCFGWLLACLFAWLTGVVVFFSLLFLLLFYLTHKKFKNITLILIRLSSILLYVNRNRVFIRDVGKNRTGN